MYAREMDLITYTIHTRGPSTIIGGRRPGGGQRMGEMELNYLDRYELNYLDRYKKYALINNGTTNTIWPTENKPIGENKICCITYDNIGANYGLCLGCKNAFDYDSIRTWLSTRNNCPTCRQIWTNNIMYINT